MLRRITTALMRNTKTVCTSILNLDVYYIFMTERYVRRVCTRQKRACLHRILRGEEQKYAGPNVLLPYPAAIDGQPRSKIFGRFVSERSKWSGWLVGRLVFWLVGVVSLGLFLPAVFCLRPWLSRFEPCRGQIESRELKTVRRQAAADLKNERKQEKEQQLYRPPQAFWKMGRRGIIG